MNIDYDLDIDNMIDYNFHNNYNLELKKEFYKKKGLSGIINTGNKCYSDSIIQCLSHTLKLTDYLLSNKLTKDIIESKLNKKKEYSFVIQYKNLLLKLWEFNELINPVNYYKHTYKLLEKYNNNIQQDSYEYLLDIINILHEALSYEINININGEIQNETDKLMKEYLLYWKKTYEKKYSCITEIFDATIINMIECNNCKYNNCQFESFNSLNIEINSINNSTSLYNCLNNYFTSVNIKDWTCEECLKKGCNKHSKIFNVSNFLIIHLKRFDNKCNKITTHIDFPIDDLDLTSYICTQKNDPNNYIYSLYAVNYHYGTPKNGHYWCSFKNENEWYTSNDGNISKYNTKLKSELKSNLVTSDAYILFYYRKFIK